LPGQAVASLENLSKTKQSVPNTSSFALARAGSSLETLSQTKQFAPNRTCYFHFFWFQTNKPIKKISMMIRSCVTYVYGRANAGRCIVKKQFYHAISQN
jgi:hypothetical protein